MNKFKEGSNILVQSEYTPTTFYRVIFGKTRRADRCECGGVIQYLGQKKDGQPIYRTKYSNCFHIQWARDYYEEGREVLRCIS